MFGFGIIWAIFDFIIFFVLRSIFDLILKLLYLLKAGLLILWSGVELVLYICLPICFQVIWLLARFCLVIAKLSLRISSLLLKFSLSGLWCLLLGTNFIFRFFLTAIDYALGWVIYILSGLFHFIGDVLSFTPVLLNVVMFIIRIIFTSFDYICKMLLDSHLFIKRKLLFFESDEENLNRHEYLHLISVCFNAMLWLMLALLAAHLIGKLHRNLRPMYTIPFFSFTVMIIANFDSVKENDSFIQYIFIFGLLYLALVLLTQWRRRITPIPFSGRHSGQVHQIINDARHRMNEIQKEDKFKIDRAVSSSVRSSESEGQLTQRLTNNVSDVKVVVEKPQLMRTSSEKVRIMDKSNKSFVAEVFQDEECSICLEMFVASEVIRALPCKHTFHTDCIGPVLAVNNSCPICRSTVSTFGALVEAFFE